MTFNICSAELFWLTTKKYNTVVLKLQLKLSQVFKKHCTKLYVLYAFCACVN